MARGGGARRRGFALVVFTAAILAVGVSLDPLVDDAKRHYEGWAERVAAADDGELFRAREMLEHYMHARAADGRGWDIYSRVDIIKPRFLMLPCPDNLGDMNLDGTQDPPCGASANPLPLGSGSRFGRLPWNVNQTVSYRGKILTRDGLGSDFKDAAGNRLWYAASRNFVAKESGWHPLNLHYIANLETGWLTVRNGRSRRSFPGEVLNVTISESGRDEWDKKLERVAAVIIAPGVPLDEQQRIEEDALTDANLRTADRRVKADFYFEEVDTPKWGTIKNHENDGEFVAVSRAPWMQDQSNDILTFTTLDDLTNPDFPFMRGYKKQMGMSAAQNSPYENSPLDAMRRGISAYYNSFGFYPTPAALKVERNVTTRVRHCAEWKIPKTTVAMIPKETALLAPVETEMTIVTVAAGVSTVALIQDSPFLAAERVTIALTLLPHWQSSVILEDNPIVGWNPQTITVTLARLARMTLTAGSSFAISASLSGTEHTISAGMTVFPSASVLVTLPDDSLLTSDGMLFGWLPEHSRPEKLAGRDRSDLISSDFVRVGFMSSDAVLTTSSETVTIVPGDKLSYPPKIRMRLEENPYDAHRFPKLVLDRVGVQPRTLSNAVALLHTRKDQGLALLLTTDAHKSSGAVAIESPAVVYPWRSGETEVRDNLHPYPPCFDSRDVLVDSSRLFMEDQPMHYAVAADCHYGGENCGGGNGLNISVAAGVEFGLPSDYTVASDADYVMTLAIMPHASGTIGAIDRAAVTIVGGVVDGIQLTDYVSVPMITLRKSQWVLADRAGDARGRMTLGFKLTVSATLTFPAETRFRSTVGVVVDKVRALIMYSPGPLNSAECVWDIALSLQTTVTIAGVPKTVADQHREGLDLRKPCNWLDLDENADGDENFAIPPPKREEDAPDFNDYFILFGGRVSVVAS